MRSPDVMTTAQGKSVLLVSRRHVDLGRLASALCSAAA
ncbi:putative leader peptide [Actinospica robiniae]